MAVRRSEQTADLSGTRRGGRMRSSVVAAATAGIALLVAACVPMPDPGPDPVPAPPVINAFSARSERTGAPVVATLGWQIRDANRDPLTCRVDIDGDGALETTVDPCTSTSSLLSQFDTPGSRTLTLEVDDGDFPPVRAETTLVVGDGPSESYQIDLRLDPGMRPEFAQAFADAAQRWEEVIVAGVSDEPLSIPGGFLGWIPAFDGTVDDLLIDARDTQIDGPGKVLGRAGGLVIRPDAWQPYWGFMEFDTADLDALDASGRLDEVILHEMGHVLGIGPSWLLTGRIADLLVDPAYTGRAGVAAYQELGGDRFVPVENDGQLGTVIGHWREATFGDELMTGFLTGPSQPLSRVTIASLADNGYGVDLGAADLYSLPDPLAALRVPHDEDDHLHTDWVPPFDPEDLTPG